jgi:tRNA-specific 2-thiouridylase
MLRGKVAVAMSGGVDSAVSALLLRDSGYLVHAIFMRTWNAEDFENPLGECPWKTDLSDARAVCDALGVTFEVVNMIEKYRKLVVEDLVGGYRSGTTPNPDVLCNARIKFGELKKYANERGFEKFATGHYCRTVERNDGSIDILEGVDKNKDQSYFLAMLSQDQVRGTLFPVGELKKPDVRKLAAAAELPNCKKKDSQGICFLGKVKIQNFLSNYIANSTGEIVDANGNFLGTHSGLFRFTIGQRHGINLPSNRDFAHYVVVGKDMERNRLIVELENVESQLLYGRKFAIHGLSFINKTAANCGNFLARPRYRDQAQPVEFAMTGEKTALVVFEKPQRAIAPGQVIAFYEGETLLGGGVFS